MNTVSELMTHDPVRVSPDTPLAACALALYHGGFRHLPVTDGDGRLLGVLTDISVFSHGALSGPDAGLWFTFDPDDAVTSAADLMSSPLVTTAPGDALTEALQRILDARASAAFVLDGDRLAGVLTEHDALRLGRRVVSRLLSTRALSSRPVQTIDGSAPVSEAWDLMLGQRIRHLIVTEEGKLTAVVSFRDLARAIGAGDAAVWSTRVADVWGRERPIFLRGDLSFQLAVGLMVDEKIGCLPVVHDDMSPYGVITRTDVIENLIGELEDIARAGAGG